MIKQIHDPQIVSERIKSRRKECGIKTQDDLANISGVPKSSIKKFEAGIRVPDQHNLGLIARALNVDPFYLIGETDFKNDWSKYDSEHLEEIIRIKHELLFFDYCEKALGCDFSDFDDESGNEFLNQCKEAIINIYETIKKDV